MPPLGQPHECFCSIGELVRHPAGITFEIVDADPRRIKRVRLHLPGSQRPDEGDVT